MTLLALSGPSGICLAECRCSQYRNAVASACLCSIETGPTLPRYGTDCHATAPLQSPPASDATLNTGAPVIFS